jgi:putative FmdB family regulatory protein
MPTYHYQCSRCDGITEHYVLFNDRHDVQQCALCGSGGAEYRITMPHTSFFEPYHDESLNCDIYGKRHREQVMVAEGVTEAGDRVGGARNFDVNASNGGVLPLQGVNHDDGRRGSDKRRDQAGDMVVGVDSSNAYGETRTAYYKVKDLESKSETGKSISDAIRE